MRGLILPAQPFNRIGPRNWVALSVSLLCFQILYAPLHATAEVQNVSIERNSDSWTLLSQFSFTSKGRLLLNVSHLVVFSPEKAVAPDTFSMGFLLAPERFVGEVEGGGSICALTSMNVSKLFNVMEMEGAGAGGEHPPKLVSFKVPTAGQHRLYFVNCATTRFVSADVSIAMFNEGSGGAKYYLPAGTICLSVFHVAAGVAFIVMTAIWVKHVSRVWFQTVTPLAYHLNLTLLLGVNVVLYLLLAARLVFVQFHGSSALLTIITFILQAIHAVGLMAVFFSGFMYMDPYCSDFERTVLFLTVPTLILSELGKTLVSDLKLMWMSRWQPCIGSLEYFFQVANTASLCILAALLLLLLVAFLVARFHLSRPVVSRRDDREAETPLTKFYVVATIALLATILLKKLSKAILPFYLTWFGDAVVDAAVVAGYAYVLHRFRPRAEKSVYQLFDEDDTLDEEINDL